jgi:hypothetical protein
LGIFYMKVIWMLGELIIFEERQRWLIVDSGVLNGGGTKGLACH